MTSAELRFSPMLQGRRPRGAAGPPVGDSHAGAHLLAEFGAEDLEHPTARPPRLQHVLTRIMDEANAASLIREAVEQHRPADAIRLRDLADPSVSHDYLWLLGEAPTGGLSGEDNIIDLRLRVGASQVDDSRICGSCGRKRLDPQARHAQCCAPGPANAGHNNIRDAVFDLVHMADANAETEVLGLLCTAPPLRPADILTSAVPGAPQHALDVSVAAPLAAHAGPDACASAEKRKTERYQQFLAGLREDGIQYMPLVWSFWGREGEAAASTLVSVARRAARRRGLASLSGI